MPKFHFGLTSNTPPDYRMWDATLTSRGDTYITPFPELWGNSGFHMSIHRDGHVHLKSARAGVHEDISDFKSILRFARKPVQGTFKQPKEGQPANIILMPFEPLRYLGTSTGRNLMMDIDSISRSAIEISLEDNSNLPYRMDSLRSMGYARPGDIALIHSPESNEISTFVFPSVWSKRNSDRLFFTMKSEFLKGDPKSIMKQMPFLKPMHEPMTRAMTKVSSFGYMRQMPGVPKINPFRKFELD